MRSNLGLPDVIAAPSEELTQNRRERREFELHSVWKFLLRGRQPDVLLDLGRERCTRGNLNFLAVLDQSDGAEKHGEGYCCANFTVALPAFRTSKADVVIGNRQVLQLNIKLATLSHHSGAVSVRNDGSGVRAFRYDDGLTHLHVVIEEEFDRIVFVGCFSSSDRWQISAAFRFLRESGNLSWRCTLASMDPDWWCRQAAQTRREALDGARRLAALRG